MPVRERLPRGDCGIRPSAMMAGVVALLHFSTPAAWAEAATEAVASTPCLEQLNAQKGQAVKAEEAPKKPEKPGWMSRNADKIFGGVGAIAGAAIGRSVCHGKNRSSCMLIGAAAGGLLGGKLGKMMSEADQKRYQEAAYKVALTGRPQSLSLEKGCMVVEPAAEETFEVRQVELALGPGVVPPQKLRSVAETYVHDAPSELASGPRGAAAGTQVAAKVPSFVMGSTDSGRYYLIGRDDPDQGYVGAGYVDAKGWIASPGVTPGVLSPSAGQPSMVKLGVEVPCRQVSSSIRIEASNKTETFPGKVCRMPNGVPESTL